MPDLDFEEARRDLRDQIEVPGYDAVRSRARAIRRRRSWSAIGAAVACLAIVGTASVLVSGQRTGPSPDYVPASASADALPAGAVWRGGPITLHGLNGPVLDIPGDVRDVQFGDSDHGYALATRCERGAGQPCDLALAASADGGRTWQGWNSPISQAPPGRLPKLITVDPTGIVLSGESTWFRRYGQAGWLRVNTSTVAPADIVGEGRLTLAPTASTAPSGCVGRALQVWGKDGSLSQLTNQPAIDACWVSPPPVGDGSWWVGGMVGGDPAVAVSRDSGRTWQVSTLDGPAGAWAQVSRLATDMFISVVTARGGNPDPDTLSIEGVFRSADGGPFTLYGERIGTVIGDVVPLVDGRLLTAGPRWYLTAGVGAELKPIDGSLPPVHRIQATAGGWVALDLFDNGWTAISGDGETWQKINVR